MPRNSLIVLYLCLAPVFLMAQTGDAELAKANEYFLAGNYVQSLELYQKLESKYPSYLAMKRKMATCNLNIIDYRSKALSYLKDIYNSGSYDDKLLLELAQACQYSLKFDSAIVFYTKYREKVPARQQAVVDHYIETCENAKELIKKPVKVRFENLGKEINSQFPDYYPFVTQNQGALYFTSRREECLGTLRTVPGYFSSDVFVAKVKNGQWQKARNAGETVNTLQDDEAVGLSYDGKAMVIYIRKLEYGGDLLYTEQMKNKTFATPISFNLPVNSGLGLEPQACFSADGNMLYFVSYRPGGFGQADIYFTRRLPNGEWGVPQNAGPNVNTKYSEGFPLVSEDGKTLSFTSQGHTSMGGYDIFRSKWDDLKQQWGEAINVGYPVNTPDDDMMFSLAANNRDGYLSACRKEGFGDLDIYKITFLDAETPLTAIVGNVTGDTTKAEIEASISIFDLQSNSLLETKNVNKKTGRYIFIVEPGQYRVEIKGKGFKSLKEEITVYDKSDFTVELEKNFSLMADR